MDIEIRGLAKDYISAGQPVRALHGVDLSIPANQIFTLLGPSGCGKTTLLRCIVGLEMPTDGEIRIGGDVVYSRAKGIAVPPDKRGLGMVFQTYAIWPHMTVFDNVAYPLQVRNESKADIARKVHGVLDMVQLPGLADRSATQLSGGQQQRVALARALVAEPKVILFDEPLSNLDAKLREDTRKQLRRFMNELAITAVYVTHDRVEALALSDQIAVMRAGHIIEQGSPQKIYFDSDSRFVSDFIGRTNMVAATVREQHADCTLAESPWGTLRCQKTDMPVGTEATLCIRPEFMRLTRDTVSAQNILSGQIDAIEFVGEMYETEIRIGHELLLARVPPGTPIEVGQTLHFAVAAEHCRLVTA